MTELDDATVRTIARNLSRWFGKAARDLPWRRTRDPYAIWVSEIMLQQTRVETVERYWGPFLERFPTVESLACADEDAVLARWSGLGYYRRARMLHRGAQHVHAQHGGEMPREHQALREIPGIGPYTAGAIGAIAFDQPTPLVDGNVARVHARLAAIADPAEQDAKARAHWQFVERVLGHGRPRVLAQALMELGATVCTPRSPACAGCPVRGQCRAHASGQQATIPAVKIKRASPEAQLVALALRRGDRVLLERRPDDVLLGNLWCLPLFELADPEPDAVRAAVAEQLGVDVTLTGPPSDPIKHVFTHRVWHVRVWPARTKRAVALTERDDGRTFTWHGDDDEPPGGIPTLTKKLLAKA
jgi:A/G-specific adenine glycosylase